MKQAAVLEMYQNNIVKIYDAMTNIPLNDLEEMMKTDTWLTAEEAKEIGFIDEIIKLDKNPESGMEKEEMAEKNLAHSHAVAPSASPRINLTEIINESYARALPFRRRNTQ